MAERRRNEEARREMLAAIRRHLAASAPHDALHQAHHARQVEAEAARTGPAVLAPGPAHTGAERFKQALEAVGGHCSVVRGEAEAAAALRRVILGRGARRIAVSDSPLALRVATLAVDSGGDTELFKDVGAAELFECDLGVTGAQWAVAETGTLVLESDAERHRLASLVPAVHVAFVEASRVRETLGEVLEAVGARGHEGLSRAITFITGPSRTSDIELTLAIGVHGPAELYVIIIDGEGNG